MKKNQSENAPPQRLSPSALRLMVNLKELGLIPESGYGQVEFTFRAGQLALVRTTETKDTI